MQPVGAQAAFDQVDQHGAAAAVQHPHAADVRGVVAVRDKGRERGMRHLVALAVQLGVRRLERRHQRARQHQITHAQPRYSVLLKVPM